MVFTSGGTEGDNHAILGAVRRLGGVAVCPAAEHHAVLHCVEYVNGVVVRVNNVGTKEVVGYKKGTEDNVGGGGGSGESVHEIFRLMMNV